MKKSKTQKDHIHHAGCGCTPELLVNMMEHAGQELTRRKFVKNVTVAGTLVAAGGLATSMLSGCNNAPGSTADIIYRGGQILTMAAHGERLEALAVKDGTILAAGSLNEVMKTKGDATKIIELDGKCMMPGFIDPHSHVVLQSAKFSTANLDPIPIGKAGTMDDIKQILKDWIKEQQIEPGKWVIGWGYDDTGIKEQRHPTRHDLDEVSTEHPILLMHISAHFMTGNSKMLEVLDITAETPNPDGGVIRREEGSKQPNGVLEELAMTLVLKDLPMPSPERAMEMIEEGLSFYSQAGITTAQDCASGKGSIKLLETMDSQGKLPVDVIVWPLYKGLTDEEFEKVVADRTKRGRLRRGGVKLTVDGSIQGYTAYLSKPYYVQPGETKPFTDKCFTSTAERIFMSEETEASIPDIPKNLDELHRGYPNMKQEEVDTWLKRCDEKDIPIQCHTNGDGATDMLIEAVKKVRGDNHRPDLRTTIVHAQTMRQDQLDVAKEHGLTPSFFPIHVYFWGDRHLEKFLGPERAAQISPSRSALDRGIKITLHHDAPVAGIEMLTVAWSAVNRLTSGGKDLGPDEKITPFEALRAITADAAWQIFDEDRKGTLEVGKLADMVILSDDPLAIDPMKIRDVKVMETIKEGVSVFKA